MIKYLMGDLLQNPGSLFQAFSKYNQAIWPIQIAAYALAAFVILLAVKRVKYSDNIILFILSFYWLWAGIVCLFGFLAPDFPIFYMLGVMAVFQGILFLYFGFKSENKLLSFSFKADIYGMTGAIYIIYALIIYPIIGYLTGHPLHNYPVFGVAPCPVCIFTLGLLIIARRRFPLILLIVPLIESLLGIIPTLLGLYADIGLIIAGLVGFYLIMRKRRQT
ncbi:MAG: DUF6064 family protein [Anaerolineales bacterium]